MGGEVEVLGSLSITYKDDAQIEMIITAKHTIYLQKTMCYEKTSFKESFF
jgi:hypothetical protein